MTTQRKIEENHDMHVYHFMKHFFLFSLSKISCFSFSENEAVEANVSGVPVFLFFCFYGYCSKPRSEGMHTALFSPGCTSTGTGHWPLHGLRGVQCAAE
jgi:hypothetical protein